MLNAKMTTKPTEKEKCLVGLPIIAQEAFHPPISVSFLRKILKENKVICLKLGRQTGIYASSLKEQLEKNTEIAQRIK